MSVHRNNHIAYMLHALYIILIFSFLPESVEAKSQSRGTSSSGDLVGKPPLYIDHSWQVRAVATYSIHTCHTIIGRYLFNQLMYFKHLFKHENNSWIIY